MAQQQTIEINMARFENSPWGFRLHGGADFSSPLTIQKVRHFDFIFLNIIQKNLYISRVRISSFSMNMYYSIISKFRNIFPHKFQNIVT